MNKTKEDRKDQGFTLIELLIAIVVIGILAAVAIVGIGGLTTTSSTRACKASADAAQASSAAYYANQTPNAWPASIEVMHTTTPSVFTPPAGASYPDATH